jgi:hypothetical protein
MLRPSTAEVRPAADLVHDLARLFLGDGIDAPPLRTGEVVQRADRQADIQRQRHPGREQAVAAEQGHEPRRPGRHERRRTTVVLDEQRTQVALGLAQDLGQYG